jgi:pyridoxal phosphate enzyme (YggS family)
VIAERFVAVQQRIDAACAKARRESKSVTLIAVSKGHAAVAVREAYAAGLHDIGENYAQELVAKQAACDELPVRWHFIGRLQRNKAKLVAGKVELVHAVDSLELAQELGKRAGATQPVLISVNLAGETTKGGITAAALPELAKQLADIPNIRLEGLMTMPPPDVDPRPHFEQLRKLGGELRLPLLSMGMSDDFEVAIACGATHVRVGTAIFGPRAA